MKTEALQPEYKADLKALHNRLKVDNANVKRKLCDVEIERDDLLYHYMELQERDKMLEVSIVCTR
jgi:hypothetical protein